MLFNPHLRREVYQPGSFFSSLRKRKPNALKIVSISDRQQVVSVAPGYPKLPDSQKGSERRSDLLLGRRKCTMIIGFFDTLVVPREEHHTLLLEPIVKPARFEERGRSDAALNVAVLYRNTSPRILDVTTNAVRPVSPLADRDASVEAP
jgi:hypothetical protein